MLRIGARSRTLGTAAQRWSTHRSTAFGAATIARAPRRSSGRLDLPYHEAAAAGIEPASGRLTAAYPYQHGYHRNNLRTAGPAPHRDTARGFSFINQQDSL